MTLFVGCGFIFVCLELLLIIYYAADILIHIYFVEISHTKFIDLINYIEGSMFLGGMLLFKSSEREDDISFVS